MNWTRILPGAAAIAAAGLLAMMGGSAQASTLVFADDFNDGDFSDWTFSTNYGAGTSGLDPASGRLGPYINAPPGGLELTARASRSLALLAGDYTLDLDALSVPCGGCVLSYDVLFDGVLLARTASLGVLQHRQFDLGSLTSGAHTLTLGMHTTYAQAGHFLAQFDNVALTADLSSVSPAPEPGAWALMILGFGGAGAALRGQRQRVAA